MLAMTGMAASASNVRNDTRTDSLQNSQKQIDNALLMGNGLIPLHSKNQNDISTVNDLADVNTL